FRPSVLAFHPGTALIAARANQPGREPVAPGHRAARSYYLRLAASRTTATRRRVDDVAGALKRPPDPAHRPAPTSLDSSGGEGLSPPSGARAFDSSLATLAPAGRGAPTREGRALGEARLSHVRAAQSLLHVGSPERTHAVLPHAARGVPRRRRVSRQRCVSGVERALPAGRGAHAPERDPDHLRRPGRVSLRDRRARSQR